MRSPSLTGRPTLRGFRASVLSVRRLRRSDRSIESSFPWLPFFSLFRKQSGKLHPLTPLFSVRHFYAFRSLLTLFYVSSLFATLTKRAGGCTPVARHKIGTIVPTDEGTLSRSYLQLPVNHRGFHETKREAIRFSGRMSQASSDVESHQPLPASQEVSSGVELRCRERTFL